jgi:hypothetical protein
MRSLRPSSHAFFSSGVVMSQSGRREMRGAMQVADATPNLEYNRPYEDSWEL